MSKTKKDPIGHYEVLFIIPNKFTEQEAKKVVSNVKDIIESTEGKITFEEFWGKKRLAYKIKNNEYGYYSLYEFDLERKNLPTLNKNLRLNADVLRHQIISVTPKTEEEIKKNEEIKAKIDSRKEEEVKKEEEKEEKLKKESKLKKENKEDEEKKEQKEDKKKENKKEEKENLNDLDEKLEGILNADDLI